MNPGRAQLEFLSKKGWAVPCFRFSRVLMFLVFMVPNPLWGESEPTQQSVQEYAQMDWEDSVQSLFSSGQIDQALDVLTSILVEQQDDERALRWLSICLTEKGQPRDAVKVLDRLLARNPDSQKLLKAKAISLRYVGQAAKANAILDKAANLDKTNETEAEQDGEGAPHILNIEQAIDQLKNSNRNALNQALRYFDDALNSDPKNHRILLDKCAFLWEVVEADITGYDLATSCFDDCLSRLSGLFPDTPEVLMFRAQFLSPEEKIDHFLACLSKRKEAPFEWIDIDLASIHKTLAECYSLVGENASVLTHSYQASRLNPAVDLSLIQARGFLVNEHYSAAIAVLLSKLDDPGASAAELSEKGSLLLDLGRPFEAKLALEKADELDHEIVSQVDFGWALLKCGEYGRAERAFECARELGWQLPSVLLGRFLTSLHLNQGGIACQAYSKLMACDDRVDFFGKYRLLLFLEDPNCPWGLDALMGIFRFVGLMVLCCLIPLLVVLPVHYLGLLNRKKRWVEVDRWTRWRLLHAYGVGFVFCVVSILTAFFFHYAQLTAWFRGFDDVVSFIVPKSVFARSGLFFIVGMAALALTFLRKADLELIKKLSWSWKKVITVAFGLSITFLLFLMLYRLVTFGAIGERVVQVLAIRDQYGLWLTWCLIGFVVPFYEELFFREIFLSAFSRHIPFLAANVLQAAIFGFIHLDPRLFIFFLVFGFVAGYLRRQSNSVVPAILFHCLFNSAIFVFWVRFIPYPF